MADTDDATSGARFQPAVPARGAAFGLKGCGSLDWGMQSRLARNTMGTPEAAGTVERTIPRVVISASAYGSSGMIDRSTRSSPVVGPWK